METAQSRLSSSAQGRVFCLLAWVARKGQGGMLLLKFWKGPHHNPPGGPCKVLLPCKVVLLLSVNPLCSDKGPKQYHICYDKVFTFMCSGNSSFLHCTSQRKVGKVIVAAASMVSSVLSDCSCRLHLQDPFYFPVMRAKINKYLTYRTASWIVLVHTFILPEH